MDKEQAEFFISYILSSFADDNGVEVKDIKVKEDRLDGVFAPHGRSYLVEVTYK